MKNIFRKRNALIFALPLVALIAWAGVAGATSTGISGPMFNVHTGVDYGIDNESDFLRIRKSDGTKVNTIEACSGELNLWFYVHNGQSSLNNSVDNSGAPTATNQGVGVATNTRVSIRPLPTTYGKSQTLTGKITADNADTVTDTASITCASDDIKVEYESIEQLYLYNPTLEAGYALSGDITSEAGAQLGFAGGRMPGCWDYRTIILVKVKITKKPPVVKLCVLADPNKISRTKYDLTANVTATNTTVQSYTFTVKNSANVVVDTKVFNTSALSQTYNFEQATPGTYTVKAVVMTADGQAEGDCVKTVTVEEEPKTPAYSCDLFTLTFVDRKATVSFKPTAINGPTFKDATIQYIADGVVRNTVTTSVLNGEGKVVSTYTFAQSDKNVEAKATVRFNVTENNQVVVKEVQCAKQGVLGVTTIPNTGAGSVAGLMTAVTVVGAVAHRKLTLRKNS